jgi:hypothetical protein
LSLFVIADHDVARMGLSELLLGRQAHGCRLVAGGQAAMAALNPTPPLMPFYWTFECLAPTVW